MSESYRTEKDSLGEINVPSDKLWGAQTQRSYQNFKIGAEKMPQEIILGFANIKKACAVANNKLKKLEKSRMDLIVDAANKILKENLQDNFPLSVWQTGSGTHTNMNVNEVIANLCAKVSPGTVSVHPNDHVNMSQSSNDTFPSAMKIAALCAVENKLLPALENIIKTFKNLENENQGILKIARTHLQDAVPIFFSQEISGWRGLLEEPFDMIKHNLRYLRKIALGATAVGTGLNAPKNFDKTVCKILSDFLKTEILPDENKFHALTSLDAFAAVHGILKSLAANLMKIANDIRFLSGGPRCGLSEITIPQNEPGSSIMPGKVNPTQCEAVTMVAVQVMANDVAVGTAASQGNFELNVFLPVCIYNFLQSVRLLSDGINSFEKNCVRGIKPIIKTMNKNSENSLMLVTALSGEIGYDNAAKVAKKAYDEEISVKDALLKLGFLNAQKADEILNPENMI